MEKYELQEGEIFVDEYVEDDGVRHVFPLFQMNL